MTEISGECELDMELASLERQNTTSFVNYI